MGKFQILAPLAGENILTLMITPAVLISACGTLIFSTSARLGRAFDRVNALKSELEGVLSGKLPYPTERLSFLSSQLELQRRRAPLIQKSLAALYTATGLFIASSLSIAFTQAFAPGSSWLATILALIGGLFLFAASTILIYESRFNLTFINRHLDFIEFLRDEHSKGNSGTM
jgi:hypothetical protein